LEKIDITVIGAGVVGLAVAAEVSGAGRKVYLLEKNETFGREASSRNSEVIHAGIYYPEGSLKAELCLEGNRRLYEICAENSIPYNKCGKLIIAPVESELEPLQQTYERGIVNGVPLEMLSKEKMAQLEPELVSIAAFYSPETGIVDAHSLMRYYLAVAREKGVQVAYKTRPVGIEKINDGYKIEADSSSSILSFTTAVVINCAGLQCDLIAEMAGIDIDEANYRLQPLKGEYYSVSGGSNKRINRLIYPVPSGNDVGVHVCLDVDWRLRLGPLLYEVENIDYKIDDSQRNVFLGSSIMKALPFIKPEDLEPESAGIASMLPGRRQNFRDFIIKNENDHGLPGFINLVGIDSPGLTSSPAIARSVAGIVDSLL
jgi:L-2-hydroxyglutarate oxidase LhgO